jgi:hypothetical protein
MKVGALIYVAPSDPTVGIFLGPADVQWRTEWIGLDGEVNPLHRSSVLFDDDIYSVPTFQLEVINESR